MKDEYQEQSTRVRLRWRKRIVPWRMANVDHEQRSSRITESLKDKWQDPVYRSKMEADRQKRRKPITIDGTQYSSVKEASQTTNIPESTILTRIKNPSAKFAGYSFISEQEK